MVWVDSSRLAVVVLWVSAVVAESAPLDVTVMVLVNGVAVVVAIIIAVVQGR